ncbi:hypothetical protein [Lacinutrix sp. Hel_I_90]|uniref:hypothetical protein n=1 Tax=Lacinutrix sp. Hel_I_90 TaxID=1249999 RepID=UPI0005C8EBF7|nr:hypothetical protein [Lacinutrix sp. Hel_I_90]
MENNLVITNKEALSLLLSNSTFDRITFNFPNLKASYNQYWSEKVEKVYHACGCTTGFQFMFSSFIMSILYLVLRFGHVIEHPYRTLMEGFVFILVMTLLGKVIGLFLARIKLMWYVREIKKITF